MPEVFVLPVIRREDYDTFRRDIGVSSAETYDEWSRLFAQQVAEARLHGKNVVLAQTNYEQFTQYCRSKRKKPDPQILLDFAISTRPVGEA